MFDWGKKSLQVSKVSIYLEETRTTSPLLLHVVDVQLVLLLSPLHMLPLEHLRSFFAEL